MRIAIAALMALMLSGLATAAHAQPPGSYLRSCTDIRMRGDTLLAVCRRADGRMQRSVLADVNRCVGDIGNQDGELVCNRARGARGAPPPPAFAGPAPPPPGPHRHGCRELSEEYHRLRDRYYHPYGPDERERLVHRMREIDVELARSGCPPSH
jgi:hypothetical protein